MKGRTRMTRGFNIFVLLIGWAVLVLWLLATAGFGNFVLYYGLKDVIVITREVPGFGVDASQKPAEQPRSSMTELQICTVSKKTGPTSGPAGTTKDEIGSNPHPVAHAHIPLHPSDEPVEQPRLLASAVQQQARNHHRKRKYGDR